MKEPETYERDVPAAPLTLDEAQATRRVFTLILLSVFAPGSAQIVAGGERAQRIGRAVLKAWLVLLGVVVLLIAGWFIHKQSVLGLFTHQWILRPLAILAIGTGMAWPVLVLDAWRRGLEGPVSARNRRFAISLSIVLTLVLGLTPILAGKRIWAAADLLHGVFGATTTSAATHGRYNILLLGGDAGPDRVGTRPDSMTLASVDAATGRTVLFSFPRNLQNIPFPAGTPAAKALPNGWSCGDTCLLNAIYTWGSDPKNRSLFPGVPDPGAEAMKEAIEGVSGLKVNYYVLIDLKGFQQLIDAVGGIDIDVKERVPIGGETSKIHGYIEPGEQHLDGYHALWYGRSRTGTSDYSRMARQRCVMTSMLSQLDPVTLLKHFQSIASASGQVVSTDIPAGQLPDFLTLGEKAKSQKVDSVQFVPPLIVPHHPDFTVIRTAIQKAIAGNESGSATMAPATSAPTTTRAASGTSSGASSGASSSASASPAASGAAASGASGDPAVDIRQVCAPN